MKAITYAAEVWDVDIINLSFGFSNRNNEIETAIRKADKIVFAAAANDGGNTKRAFPARYEPVICIHSTDGLGNPSNFNPTRLTRGDNFSILGEAIESAWPGYPCVRKFGTSFATPIAASVGALILHFARQNLDEELLEALETYEGMKKVLHKMSDQRGEYDYIHRGNCCRGIVSSVLLGNWKML
jgi:subtilisin family serine protease